MPNILEWLRYLLLGLLQGITEVLPISSSGHLVLAQELMQMGDMDLSFEIFLHFASLLAILWLFWPKLWRLIKGFFRYFVHHEIEDQEPYRYGWYLLLATIVTAGVGFGVQALTGGMFSALFVGICLVLNGAMLLVLGHHQGTQRITSLPWWKVALIGVFQGIGVFPGISRSGATISGTLGLNVTREEATDFAFLLFLPAAGGAALLEIPNFLEGWQATMTGPYVLGFVAAFLGTYFAFSWLRRLIRKDRFHWFGYYCFAIGIIAIIVSLV